MTLTLLYLRVSCILEEYMYMLRKFIACITFPILDKEDMGKDMTGVTSGILV